jgi:hypothetical protein
MTVAVHLTTVLTVRSKKLQTLRTINSVIIGYSTTEYISESITNQLINSLTYLLTYLLITNYTQHIFFESLTVAWNLNVQCCVQKFLFRPKLTQPTPFYPICIKTFFSVLYSHLRLRLQSWFFPLGIATKIVDAFVFTSLAATCHFNIIILP